ncbi:MAG: hypothetical protein ABI716_00055 [Candidatus Saccharibacteria bacterium]
MSARKTTRHFDDDCYDYIAAEFNRCLHSRESNFTIDADIGYRRHYGEPLLATLVDYLLTDSSGVVRIKVKDFSLTVYYDRAASRVNIQNRILTACLHFSDIEPITTRWLFYP